MENQIDTYLDAWGVIHESLQHWFLSCEHYFMILHFIIHRTSVKEANKRPLILSIPWLHCIFINKDKHYVYVIGSIILTILEKRLWGSSGWMCNPF